MGVSLSAFDFATGKKLWTKAKTTVDPTIRTHDSSPAYRDLELDANGETIWAACICDAVNAARPRPWVKLDIEGNHDASWLTEAGKGRSANRWLTTMGSSISRQGAATLVAEYAKAGPTAPAAGCAHLRLGSGGGGLGR